MNLDLSRALPKSLENSLLCFTFIFSPVLDCAPDIAICTSNGYIYEFKKKKIVGSLNINGEKASSISVYQLYEKYTLILYYLVFTDTSQLLLVKRSDNQLQKVMTYKNVEKFEVYDFQCSGYPQIKINFHGSQKTEMIEFPVDKTMVTHNYEDDFEMEPDTIAPSLSEKYEMMKMHISELNEECNNIKKISSTNNISKENNCSLVPVCKLKITSDLKEEVKPNFRVVTTCRKMSGKNWILGMEICNSCEMILDDLELVINQKKIDRYSYCWFLTTPRHPYPSIRDSSALQPSQKVFLTVVFRAPAFVLDSKLSAVCYLASSHFENCLKIQEFDIGIAELVMTPYLQMDYEFTIVDLMALMTTNVETRITVDAFTEEKDLIESVLVNNLGFTKLKHFDEKFFYCTSTYLNEVGIALQQKTVELHVWNMHLYTGNVEQVYFLVNALYELLPEKTTILCCAD